MKISLITKAIIALMVSVCATVDSAAAAIASGDVEVLGTASRDALQPSMKPVDDGLELSASPDEASVFMIYSITGQLVKNIRVEAGEQTVVALKGGCYVVRCKAWAKKIALR